MTNIPLDLGYNYTQGIRDNRRVIFPTIYGEVSRSNLDILASQNGLDITTQDGSWMFGETALLQSSNASHPLNDDWFTTPQYRALALLAISELYAATTHHIDVTIWTGLPYQFHSQREQLKKNLIGLHKIERHSRPGQTINIQDVKVYVQNFAPIIRLFNEIESGFVGCINIGGNTIEIATGKLSNGKIEPIHNQCRTNFGGVLSVVETLRKRLAEKFLGETLKDHEIVNILRTGKVKLYNKEYDCSEIVNPIKEQYQQMVLNLMSDVWSKQMPVPLSRLSRLVLSGGGANLVNIEGTVVSNEPQWDTVEGYLLLSKMV